MSPAQQAHLRLLHQIPAERVRTHHQGDNAEPPKAARRRSIADTKQLHLRIAKLKRQGLSNVEVACQCAVTPTTVSKHTRGYIKSVLR